MLLCVIAIFSVYIPLTQEDSLKLWHKCSLNRFRDYSDNDDLRPLIIASRSFTTLIIQQMESRCAINNSRQYDWIKVNL